MIHKKHSCYPLTDVPLYSSDYLPIVSFQWADNYAHVVTQSNTSTVSHRARLPTVAQMSNVSTLKVMFIYIKSKGLLFGGLVCIF